MIVELYDHAKKRVTAPPMTPLRYSASAIGGPANAMLQVATNRSDLLRLVGHYVIVRNTNGTPVWWGKVEEVLIDMGRLQIGVSQRELRNRIATLYTYLDGEGIPTPAETTWAEDIRSIAVYGRFEERHTLGEASAVQALAVRDRALASIGLPRPALKINRAAGESAILRCIGLWETLRQTYYANPVGRELFTDPHSTEQILGWALTSSNIGFADKSIQVLEGGLEVLAEADKFTVVGSQQNDGTWTVFNVAQGKYQSYTANTIEFDPSDDINDSAAGFGFIRPGRFIKVTGSPLHSGWHLTDIVERGHIATDETVTGNITFEAAGPTITLEQGQSLAVEGEVITEIPGNPITITAHGVRLAYSFTITDPIGWTAAEVWVKLKRVGSPVDSVKVELCVSSGGLPGAVLDFATVPGASLLQRMAWVQFHLSNTVTVTPATTYWLVISRTGANNSSAYYTVGLDENVGHPGQLRLWTGSGWATKQVPAALPFQLWGHTTTTEQIQAVLTQEGQYFAGISVRHASTITRRQYRDGSLSAYDELADLLDAGERLLPRVTPDWHVVIEPLPAQSPQVQMRRDGTLTNLYGQPLEQGVLPVGQWCAIDGVPDTLDALAPLSPFVIGFLEYNAERDEISDIRALDSTDIWAVGEVRQG